MSALARPPQDVDETGVWTVILHPGVVHQQISMFVEVGEPPMPSNKAQIDFVQVSPFALESVERVARAIRWATLAPKMLSYPPHVDIPPRLPSELITDLTNLPWTNNESNQITVNGVAPDYELQQLDLEGHKRDIIQKRQTLEEKRDELTSILDQARGDRRETSQINRERRELLEPLRDAQKREEQTLIFIENFQKSLQLMKELSCCPVCNQNGTLNSHQDHTFDAQCHNSSCSARWSLRKIEDVRLPLLYPGDAKPGDLRPEDPPQRAGELWGSDVLGVFTP